MTDDELRRMEREADFLYEEAIKQLEDMAESTAPVEDDS